MLPRRKMPKSPRQARIPRHRARPKSPNAALAAPRKPSQRERLLRATIDLTADLGFGDTSVSELTARAGISRATFYELYADKEELFAAAYLEASRHVLSELRRAVRSNDFWEALQASLTALLGWLEREPAAGWMVMVEAMAGEQRVRAERKRLGGEFERFAEELMEKPAGSDQTLDLPAPALLGGVRAVVTARLRQHEADRLPGLQGELLTWMRSYAIPAGRPRWSASPGAVLTETSHIEAPTAAPLAPRKPRQLPRGNHRLAPGVVARNHRQRIIHATAELAQRKGYQEMTVSNIVAGAGIARSVFYEHFHDKLDAFLNAQQQAAQVSVATCASAFFGADSWPERVWNALGALSTRVAGEPALAHLLLVESFAAGPAAIERFGEMLVTFRIFLEEGYHLNTEASQLPRLCSEGILGAIFEIVYDLVAHGRAQEVPGRVAQLAYIAIAPFTGSGEAIALIEQLAERSSASADNALNSTADDGGQIGRVA